MNTTFFNPSFGVPCEKCDFTAKSNGGLQVHMRAKHKENKEKSNLFAGNAYSETIALETDAENIILKCDQCDFVAENRDALKEHTHDDKKESSQIKLEIFGIVDFGNSVLDARKAIIEKLSEQEEVEQVLTAYVNKN